MIDIHHHCLPGVDDGPRNVDDAVDLCQMSAEEGIETIVATPHVLRGRWKNTSRAQLEGLIADLQARAGAPRLLLGSEYFFAHDVAEVRSYLERTAPVTARPVVDAPLPIFVLATGRGIEVAAALGLPVVLGGPVLFRPDLGDLLASYRRDFRPHRDSRPYVNKDVDVLVADTDAEARELALPEVWAMVRSRRTGVFDALEPVAAIRDRRWDDQDADRVARGLDAVVAGRPETVRRRIEQLVERTGADELLAGGVTYDRAALAASDASLAALLR